MEKTTTVAQLRASILLLEIQQKKEGKLLKEQFNITYENLRPVNLIRNTIRELATTPGMKDDLLTTSISMVTGFLAKKAVVGNTNNPIKQVLGSLLQMGVTSIVAKNSDGLKNGVMKFINAFLTKRSSEAE